MALDLPLSYFGDVTQINDDRPYYGQDSSTTFREGAP